jgi:LPS sulfotransferase NodH
MNKIDQIFNSSDVDLDRLRQVEASSEARSRFLIAITPRSGSSYLCDVMTKIKLFGVPGEVMNQEFIPNIIKSIPGRNPEEYIRNVIRFRKTKNGISGMKASWFQFQNFKNAMADHSFLSGFKYIYLTRRDLAAQAVSLYKATETTVFHTNINHSEEAIIKLQSLEYDYKKIKEWCAHIDRQEKGWQQFFYENSISPMYLTYEDIDNDIMEVLKRIATFVGVDPKNIKMPEESSVFKKIRDHRNAEWAHRFSLELPEYSNKIYRQR